MDDLCYHYLYAGLSCIIFIYRIQVHNGKQLDSLGQRPWPVCVPRSTWITHGIHIRRTRHTKYYKGKTFSFVLRVRFRTLN